MRLRNSVVTFCSGSGQNQDSEKGVSCDHREILPQIDDGLPLEQKDLRGNRRHSQQENAQ